MTTPTLCGYLEQGQDGLPCWEPGDPYCDTHREPRYRVCEGCGGDATRLCQQDGAQPRALCPECEHKGLTGSGIHGPKAEPESYGEPTEGAPQGIDAVRRELEETVVLCLRQRAAQGYQLTSNDTAAAVVQALGNTALLGLVSSLGQHRAAQSGG